MVESDTTAEVIIEDAAKGEAECPGCGCRVTTRYRLDYESPDHAVCGSCFAEWLAVETEAGTHTIEVTD